MSTFEIMDSVVLPPVVTGPRISAADLTIVEAVERELAAAHCEGRKMSRRGALMLHVPGDDDDAINQRRRVAHWMRKRKATAPI